MKTFAPVGRQCVPVLNMSVQCSLFDNTFKVISTIMQATSTRGFYLNFNSWRRMTLKFFSKMENSVITTTFFAFISSVFSWMLERRE
jgi:hypothetical protein